MGLKFDFNKAVREAYADFPALRRDTVFISVDENASIDQGLNLHQNPELSFSAPVENVVSALKDLTAGALQDDSAKAFGGMPGVDVKAVIFKSDIESFKSFGVYKEDFINTYVINHELGHILVPNAVGKAQTPEQASYFECAADAFGIIKTIQEMQKAGETDISALRDLTWMNAYDFLHGSNDAAHMTIPVVEKIIEDSRVVDFSKLSPEETVIAAEQYAKLYQPSQADLETITEMYASSHGSLKNFSFLEEAVNSIAHVANTALSTSNRFAFYIGAKAIEPFLRPEGVEINGQSIQLPEEFRDITSKFLAQRASQFMQPEQAPALTEPTPQTAKPAAKPVKMTL